MTTNSTHLVDRVRELIATGAQVDERIDTLVLRGSLPSPEAQADWIAFVDDVPGPFTSLQVYNAAFGGDLVIGETFDSEREIVITLGKPASDGYAFFMFQSAIAPYLAQRSVLGRLAIADLSPAQAFRARALEIVPWNLAQPAASPEPPLSPIDPTRYVRDFVPDREVVTDLDDRFQESCHMDGIHLLFQVPIYAVEGLETEDLAIWLRGGGRLNYRSEMRIWRS